MYNVKLIWKTILEIDIISNEIFLLTEDFNSNYKNKLSA